VEKQGRESQQWQEALELEWEWALNTGLDWYPDIPRKEWCEKWKEETEMRSGTRLAHLVLEFTSSDGKEDPAWLKELGEHLRHNEKERNISCRTALLEN
jgi:hypothetical protein